MIIREWECFPLITRITVYRWDTVWDTIGFPEGYVRFFYHRTHTIPDLTAPPFMRQWSLTRPKVKLNHSILLLHPVRSRRALLGLLPGWEFAQFAFEFFYLIVHFVQLCFEGLAIVGDQVTVGKQGERTDIVYNIHEVPIEERPSGTSAKQALRRLRNQRPDLHSQVLAGEKSPHAAMIEAGFRKRSITVPLDVSDAARILARHFDVTELIRALALVGAEEKAD